MRCKLAAPHECSCPTRHAPTCPCATREGGAHARTVHARLLRSLTLVSLGPAPVRFSIGIRNGCDQLAPNRSAPGEIEKLFKRRGSGCVSAGSNAHAQPPTTNHQSITHHIPPSTSAPHLPSTLIKGKTKEHKKKKKKASVDMCKAVKTVLRHITSITVTSPLDRADRLGLASTPRAFRSNATLLAA